MTHEQISALPMPELNKKCKEFGVATTLPLVKRREELAKAMAAKAKGDGKAKPAKEAKAPKAAAKPAPKAEEDEEEVEEETPKPAPKAKAKEAPTSALSNDLLVNTMSRIETTLSALEKKVASLDTASGARDFKLANTFGVLFKNIHEIAAGIGGIKLSDFGATMAGYGEVRNGKAKPTAAPAPKAPAEEEEEEVEVEEEEEVEIEEEETETAEVEADSDAMSEIPEAARPFVKIDSEGNPELDLDLDQVDGMDEATCRGLMEVLGIDHSGFAKGKVRGLKGALKEALQEAAGEPEETEEEEVEEEEEEVPAPKKKGKGAKGLTPKEAKPGTSVKYTDAEGEVYEGEIGDAEEMGEEIENDEAIVVFEGGTYLTVKLTSLAKA